MTSYGPYVEAGLAPLTHPRVLLFLPPMLRCVHIRRITASTANRPEGDNQPIRRGDAGAKSSHFCPS